MKAFVKMYEHDDDRFDCAGQRYLILHVNLTAVDKPAEVNTFVPFAKALSPQRGTAAEDNNPFDDYTMVPPAATPSRTPFL